MRRRLLLLNLTLVVLAVASFWYLRLKWQEGQAREERLLRPPTKAAIQAPVAPLALSGPASGSSYSEIATKMLFSQDRNPNVVIEAAPAKPVPAFPVAYGVMDLGSGPTLILSEKPGGASRGYSVGDKVGEFKLVAYAHEELVLEWEGQQFRKTLRELAPKSSVPAVAASLAQAAAPAAAPAPVSAQAVSTSDSSKPGTQVSSDRKLCTQGDTSPAGTVRDGYRKVVTQTPFGGACWWELVK